MNMLSEDKIFREMHKIVVHKIKVQSKVIKVPDASYLAVYGYWVGVCIRKN